MSRHEWDFRVSTRYVGEASVDKNIPMPSQGRPREYPWLEMEIGDSFLFPEWKSAKSCSVSACVAGRIYGRRYSIRQTSEGVWCWRVE